MMNKPELLAPAGSFEIGKAALYAGCDAIYLALESFGARAYAKNFSLDELKEIINIAHALDKKVYVTVNTLIKNDELESVYKFLEQLYLMNVDAVICADIAVFMYVINNLVGMECHISTQVGVKDLLDTKFFEEIGAERVVLARENSFEQIKEIKENTNIELEVFIHGALCVSYSGGCLFSSLLSLRSGNRGRCSQNCRREYIIYENDKPISKPGFYLSMKDLCISQKVNDLANIGVNSLKIEGRMKDINYVYKVTKFYHTILDYNKTMENEIENIFHRKYTKGFIFNEDRKDIATLSDSSSQGKYIGTVLKSLNKKIYIKTNEIIRKGDRIRFLNNENSIFITVEKILNDNNQLVEEVMGKCYIESNERIVENSQIFKMSDAESELTIDSNIIPLILFVSGKKNHKLSITAQFRESYLTFESNANLEKANKNPLTEETIFKQLSKLNDTPFYIENINFEIEDDMFISLSEINDLRRRMVEEIYQLNISNRTLISNKPLFLKKRLINNSISFIASVKTFEQYKACKDMGIETIFYENISPYVNSKYPIINEEEVLVGNYGGLKYYTNKTMTTDYSFNVMNKDSILHLLNFGAAHVTLSHEISFNELKDLSNDFYNTYGAKAPIDMIIYGRQKLMTMKYCPLKGLGLCGKCKNNNYYYLVDKIGKFILKTKEDCFVEIYNDIPLNLIEEINQIKKYVDRIRFDFTIESYNDVLEIIENAKKALNNNTHQFKLKKQTKGYFKRPII